MAMAALVLLTLLAATTPAAFATQHVVGGSSGWNLGVDYTTWASSQTFVVGDTLSFSYGPSHSVDVISQSDYDNCNNGGPQISHTGGNTVIPLNSPGTMYLICGTPGHCQGGMKLSVPVSPAPNGPGGHPSPPLPPAHQASAATRTGNFGGKMSLFLEFSMFVVGCIGFMA